MKRKGRNAFETGVIITKCLSETAGNKKYLFPGNDRSLDYFLPSSTIFDVG
jgi:hypothetical protein